MGCSTKKYFGTWLVNIKTVFETPFEQNSISSPGLPILPHGVEHYVIPGRGSRALPIETGQSQSIKICSHLEF
jgi:aminomethyltransferase